METRHKGGNKGGDRKYVKQAWKITREKRGKTEIQNKVGKT